ncbi:unnamed protein product [Moneuplotes crassus]|uniref:Kelch motif family protein n=3 Tax=Euplotes crassus TaxID=5936 RepID=A0AAD1X7X4_EUPCR|nr:unnamed protein product [Moneuplotes crassus]
MSEEDRTLNQALLEEAKQLQESFDRFIERVENRKKYLTARKELMDNHRETVFQQIDAYYDILQRQIEEKRNKVKEQYKSIEGREKRRLGFIQLQVQNTEENIKQVEDNIQNFTEEFDLDMEHQANKAGYESVKREFEELEMDQEKKTYFLRNSRFVPPTFETVSSDLPDIMDIGRIVDNCEFSEPLITMNTYNFELLEYKQDVKGFQKVLVKDDMNLIQDVPKYFRSILISSDEIAILGGYDYAISNSSKKVFFVINGRLVKGIAMQYPRQYFSLCIDKVNCFLYVIGGYNKEEGLIPYCERLSLKSKQWEEIEILNTPRMYSCSAAIGGTHVYTFGGIGPLDYLTSIERYNIGLNIWTELKVKLPTKLSNAFACSVNAHEIVILGGMRPVTSSTSSKRFVVENTVYCFNTKKYSFLHLKSLPFSKKLSNISYEGNGKIFLYIMHRHYEYPQIIMYNLNKIYPEFDRYAFTREKEKWSKAKVKEKINRITPDYYAHPDLRATDTIEDTERVRKNSTNNRKEMMEEHQMMQELDVINQDKRAPENPDDPNGNLSLSAGENEKINTNSMYRNIKMIEERESMNYNALGEVIEQEEEKKEPSRLYHVESDSSDNEDQNEYGESTP